MLVFDIELIIQIDCLYALAKPLVAEEVLVFIYYVDLLVLL